MVRWGTFPLVVFFLFGCEPVDSDGDGLPDDFRRSGDTIMYSSVVLEGVDADAFRVLDDAFCTDGRRVFYYTSYRESRDFFLGKKYQVDELHGVHPGSFRVLGYEHARDSSQAWYRGEAFHVADLASFKVIDAHFAQDDVHAYMDRKVIPGSDGRSFRLIDAWYAKDTTGYYYIEGTGGDHAITRITCDPSSFRIIDPTYAVDKEHVFVSGTRLPEARPAGFTVLGSSYARDEEHVFFRNKRVDGADPASFTLFPDNERSRGEVYYAQDKDGIYVNERPFTGVDRASFRVLDEKYTLDKNGVYFRMKKVSGADPLSFKVYPHYLGDADAEDKAHKYGDGKVVDLE